MANGPRAYFKLAPKKGQKGILPGSPVVSGHHNIVAVKNNDRLQLSSRGRLSVNLQMARTLHGWSQEQLGLHCGLKRTYIGALERGEINPGIDNLDRIAHGLGLDGYVLLLAPDVAHPIMYKTITGSA